MGGITAFLSSLFPRRFVQIRFHFVRHFVHKTHLDQLFGVGFVVVLVTNGSHNGAQLEAPGGFRPGWVVQGYDKSLGNVDVSVDMAVGEEGRL